MDPEARPSFIAIARIARARGNRGEVLADLYTDFPDRFEALKNVWLEFADGRRRAMAIDECWDHKGRKVMKFAGVDSMGAAAGLAGCWVTVPAEEAVGLPAGTYFDHDLIGCSVEDVRGNSLGTVAEVLHNAGNDLLVVRGSGRERLIPAAGSICVRISIEHKSILIDPPEGLMDLDQ